MRREKAHDSEEEIIIGESHLLKIICGIKHCENSAKCSLEGRARCVLLPASNLEGRGRAESKASGRSGW